MDKSCYKCFIVLGSINIIVCAILWYFLGNGNAISFEVAYFSAFLVVLSSYFALKAKIQKEANKTNNQSLEDDDSTPKTHTISKFVLGLRLSFGFYRIASYVILAVGVVILMNHNIFKIIGYVLGVLICLSSIILFKFKHPD